MRVHLDRGDPLEVALEALERLRLGVGDPLPPRRRHLLKEADGEVRVREAALNLLSHRARTRSELRSRLLRKAFGARAVDACLDRLEERGLLDDRAVAAAYVRDRLRHRPRGTSRLTQEVRAKGVDDTTARAVVDGVLEDENVTEEALATRVMEGWLKRQGPEVLRALGSRERSPERERARRRLYGFLARRGFRGAALTRAMDQAAEAAAARA